jgi:hypothetical protein
MKPACWIFFGVLLSFSRVSAQSPAQTIPDFKFFRFDKTPFSQHDLPRAKPCFFVFFDSECEHCQRAVKYLDAHYKVFSKCSVYLISLDDQNKMTRFMNTFGPHLKGQPNVLLLQDRLYQFIPNFKPVKYPSMFLYSAERKLIDYEDNDETVFRFVNEVPPSSVDH